MRLGLAITFILVLFANTFRSAEPVLANDAPIFGPEQELFFKIEYPKYRANKALAIGPNGVVFYSSGSATPTRARNAAIDDCNAWVSKQRGAKKAGGWCKVYAVNNQIVWTGLSPGVQSGQQLPLPDAPLAHAQIFGDAKTAKAILLRLHGCDHPTNPPDDWIMSWFEFFTARQYLVIQPDSFADPHPVICGEDMFKDYALSVEKDRLRVAQTKRTLREIGRLYPGLPIYVWGHSGGGRTIQFMSPNVKGVIISGDECGISSRSSAIPKTVPVLYIFGLSDQFVKYEGKPINKKVIDASCGRMKNQGDRKWVAVEGADHFTAIWNQSVMDAVSKFIGEKPFDLSYEQFDGQLTGNAAAAYLNLAEAKPGRRAFAAGPEGQYGRSWGMSNGTDAIQNALRSCDQQGGKPAYLPGQHHICKLYKAS